MQPLDLAQRYMAIVYGDEPVGRLRELLGEPFCFDGPLYRYESAEAYVAALEADPPEGFRYEMIGAYGDAASACLVYRFTKPGFDLPMAQHFGVRAGRIHEILLVFDATAFRG